MQSCNCQIEKKLWKRGYLRVAGVDEVGRGALAGPVVAAAVVFAHNHYPIDGVADSKVLRATVREKLFYLITHQAVAWSVAAVGVPTIDRINILQATLVAMRRALAKLPRVDYALIDGNQTPSMHLPSEAIIHGDARCYSIAAASIIAKVWRDSMMYRLGRRYPDYGWAQNKGYGTEAHRHAIQRYGMTSLHRRLFVHET